MTLLEEAREGIHKYLEGGRKRTVSDLARRADVPYSTIRRIVQGESNNVQIETIISILSAFMDQKELTALISKHSPKWKKLFGYFEEKNYEFLPEGDFHWEDVDIYILAHGSTPEGVDRQTIIREYGERWGGQRLNALLAEGILKEENGRLKTFSQNFIDPSHRSVLKRIEIHAKTFNLDHIGEGAFFRNYVQPVSDSQLEQVREVTRDYLERIFQICEDSGHSSSDQNKVLLLNLMGNFVNKRPKEGES